MASEAARTRRARKAADSANRQSHLTVAGRVNQGSFYTPAKYVALVAQWLLAHGVGDGWTVADLSCGYGAFLELHDVEGLQACRYVANDIDLEAVKTGRALFPQAEWRTQNALLHVARASFGFRPDERLAIVGNPPYNDTTSQINQDLKTAGMPMDDDLRTRDLGLSSLLAYDKLRADFVAVLHPLSYLVKESNFKAAARFFSHYRLLEHLVFSSQRFADTSRLAAFPVLVALYGRDEAHGLAYADVRRQLFRTEEGDRFSLNGFDSVTDHVAKYPHKAHYTPEILFYTLRDVNALRRCRTFIRERIANAVDVAPGQLPYYCYIDCFKRYAEIPYWLGNFDIPFIEKEFDAIADIVADDAMAHHPEIFGRQPNPTAMQIDRIKEYIKRAIWEGKPQEPP